MAEPIRVVVEGSSVDEGASFLLRGDEAVVGRDPTCDIVLSDATVSGRHGRFRAVGSSHTYTDLHSRNGSLLLRADGTRLALAPGEEVPVSPGDVLLLGSADAPVRLVLRHGAAPFAAGPSSGRTVVATRPLVDLLAPGPDPVARLAASVVSAASPRDLAVAGLAFLQALFPRCEHLGVRIFGRGFHAEAGHAIPDGLASQARGLREVTLLTMDEGSLPLTQSVVRSGAQASVLVPLVSGDTVHGLLAAWSAVGRSAIPVGALDLLGVAGALLSLAAETWSRRADDEERRRQLEREVEELKRGHSLGAEVEPVGSHPAFLAAVRMCRDVAPTDIPVLLLGETGTGKEVLARLIHRSSRRAKGPFVAFNCATVPESLMESELFGHVRGAFTGAASDRAGLFEAADGGTLFLDEVGEMPPAMQAKLLRVLEDGEVRRVGSTRAVRVDVRVVSATHRDLQALAASGAFRQDLLFRLNAISVRIPPLRERGADCILLAHHLLARVCARLSRNVPGFTAAALAAIEAHDFPGNVRELEHEIARAVVLTAEGEPIRPEAFSEALQSRVADKGDSAETGTLEAVVAKAQREAVEQALAQFEGNVTRAARQLGLTRAGLYKLMERLGIRRREGE